MAFFAATVFSHAALSCHNALFSPSVTFTYDGYRLKIDGYDDSTKLGAAYDVCAVPATGERKSEVTEEHGTLPTFAQFLAADTAAPRVFYVTPQGVAVSSDTLAGQGSSALAGNFQGLAGASVDDVIARVPSGWTWGPQRSGQGIVFYDTTGAEGIRMHGPSMNAPVGANSQMGWTLRVMDNAGNYFDNAGNVVPYRANEGHIPLLGNPNAP